MGDTFGMQLASCTDGVLPKDRNAGAGSSPSAFADRLESSAPAFLSPDFHGAGMEAANGTSLLASVVSAPCSRQAIDGFPSQGT
jgi:hypothetical protein